MTESDNYVQPTGKTLFWNRVQLIAIFVVFLAPIAGAFLYKPSKFNNYGDLYTPAPELVELLLNPVSDSVAEEQVPFSLFKDQDLWAFMVIAQGECGDACEKSLLNSRQIRAMQGKHLERTRSVLIYSDLSDEAGVDLAQKYQPISVFKAEASALERWSSQLKPEGVSGDKLKDRFYIVDSKGLLMISYPSDAEPKLVNKDLKRLLKARR